MNNFRKTFLVFYCINMVMFAKAESLKDLNRAFWNGNHPSPEKFIEALDKIVIRNVSVSNVDVRDVVIEILKKTNEVERNEIPVIEFHVSMLGDKRKIEIHAESISVKDAFDSVAQQLDASWKFSFGKGMWIVIFPKIIPKDSENYFTSPVFPGDVVKDAELAGAGQPATKPADKIPAKVQPATPTPQVVPR